MNFWESTPTDDRGGFSAKSKGDFLDWKAFTTKDGCFELIRIYNGDTEDTGQIHVCEIDDLIERLTELREMMKESGYYEGELE